MKQKLGKPITFRAWAENEERLAYAEALGISMSEAVNAVLSQHLRAWLEKKKPERINALQQVIKAPVP